MAVSGEGGATGSYTLHLSTSADQSDATSAASTLTPGTPVEGVIDPTSDVDLFRMDLSARTEPADVAIYTAGGVDTVGELWDGNENTIALSDASNAVAGPHNFFLAETLEPAVYYVRVATHETATGPYRLHTQIIEDQGDDRNNAADLPLGSSAIGLIRNAEDHDYFKLDLSSQTGNTDIWVYAAGPLEAAGELVDSDGDRIAYTDEGNLSNSQRSFLIGESLPSGVYYISVTGRLGATGGYRLYTREVTDHDSAIDDAESLVLDTPLIGLIGPGDDTDLFKLDLSDRSSTTEVFLYTSGAAVDTVGELLGSDGVTSIATDDDSSTGNNFVIRADLDPGIYYVGVQSYGDGTGAYALSAEAVNRLSIGTPLSGTISQSYEQDHFRIEVATTTDVWIYTYGSSGSGIGLDTHGTLYDSDLNPIVSSAESYILGRLGHFSIQATLEAGVYYLKVRTSRGDTGDYLVAVDSVRDPGSSIRSAASLAIDTPVAGTIHPDTDADYFRIRFSQNTSVYLYAVASDLSTLQLAVLDSRGNEVVVNQFVGFPGPYIEDEFSPGTYYVRVTAPETGASTPLRYLIYFQESLFYRNFIEGCRGPDGDGDPLYACQWRMKNQEQPGEDINVEPVWQDGILGEGVNVAVVDDGMDFTHEDLRENVDASLNHDYEGTGTIYRPLKHQGTHVAGVIAARDNNIGIRGVAPRATIYGYNYLARPTNVNLVDAMTRNMETTAVSNNSWNAESGPDPVSANRFWEEAMERGVNEGYGGRGVFYVFAGGDGARMQDNVNLDGFANFYAVTAVCAVNNHGLRSGYSEVGSPLWVCAPSDGTFRGDRRIITTENSNLYTRTFGGTATSAPMVSGVAALMREANPELTWRDLKLILAATARKNHPDNTGWEDGAQRYGSDSATDVYSFNHEYGFGVVDAKAAVDLAQEWPGLLPLPPLETSTQSSSTSRTIPDNESTGISATITVSTGIEFTEYVEIRAAFSHESFRDLEIELVSPSNRVSKLMVLAGGRHPLFDEIRMGSAKHLGEDPNGVWTLRIKDLSQDFTGSLDSWEITVYGHRPSPGAPTVDTVTPGQELLDITWSPHGISRGSTIITYDLRYIPTDDDETDDANWTHMENIWTGGNLEYTLTGLRWGTQYDVQVRAVNAEGDGLWSETSAGTPIPSECAAPGALADRGSNPDLTADCDALLAMRDTLDTTGVLNWSPLLPMSSWEGITVGGTPQRVTMLELGQRRLQGRIPSSMGTLTGLQVLDLRRNQLKGPIPPELGELVALEELRLNWNALTGRIPAQLGGNTSLTELDLSLNRLGGPIPSEIGNLHNLVRLALNENQLNGRIPDLQSLTGLSALFLSGNRLTGTIPEELGSLTNLKRLYLDRNDLSGPIPAKLGDLPNLEHLLIWDNALTGHIPTELGNLPKLVSLLLSQNRLQGQIPSELGNIGTLKFLDLSRNRLGGPIPSDLGLLSNLTSLRLNENALTGQIPAVIGGLSALESLDVSQNRLGGAIPTELGNLTTLEHLDVSQNRLEGSIPTELGDLTTLIHLDVSQNQLDGQIPAELESLIGLNILDLSQNRLEGPIPSGFGFFSDLRELHLQQNALTGEIPSQLGFLSSLEILYLSQNQLVGPIPSDLGFLTDLLWLSLSQNLFTGCIPQRLRTVRFHDLPDVGLPFCDLLLSGLTLSAGDLTPPFDPGVTSYTAVVGPPQLALTPTSNHNVSFHLIAGDDATIDDGPETGQYQANLKEDVTGIIVVVVSEDLGAVHTYIIQISRAGLPGAPTISAATPGPASLDITWTAPSETGGDAVTSYDLRYLRTASTKTSDYNWYPVDMIGDGNSRSYTLTGLASGVEHDVQVRAVNGVGPGPWSASLSGTPNEGSCSTGGAVTDPANNLGLVADCEVLLGAMDTLRGTATLDWSAGIGIEDWDGITVEGTPARVTELELSARADRTHPAVLGPTGRPGDSAAKFQ